jgi:hypothetical protein
MKKNVSFLIYLIASCLLSTATAATTTQAPQQNKYPAMAPLSQYLIADQAAEIALARSAAPASIGKAADVLVLGPKGYTTAVKGSNGFVCVVERGWATSSDNPEFWSPKIRAPICFNAAAARSYLAIYLLKTKWILSGKPRTDIHQAIATAFDSKELPVLEPGSMCYMMSKQQYLNDAGKNWHPHVMFFVEGDSAKSWGADAPDTPIMYASDPEERVTIMMLWVSKWSDGSAAPNQNM